MGIKREIQQNIKAMKKEGRYTLIESCSLSSEKKSTKDVETCFVPHDKNDPQETFSNCLAALGAGLGLLGPDKVTQEDWDGYLHAIAHFLKENIDPAHMDEFKELLSDNTEVGIKWRNKNEQPKS